MPRWMALAACMSALLFLGCPDEDTILDPADDDVGDDDTATGDDDTTPAGDLDDDGWTTGDGDCDDEDATSYPGAPELCDGLDNDCDGAVPDDEIDADGDGWTPCAGDCDDTRPGVNPDGSEICGDGLDNDCDGTPNDCALEGDFWVDDAPSKLLGEHLDDHAGWDPRMVEDIDGDGQADLLVAAGNANVGWEEAGVVYVWQGPTAPGTTSLQFSYATISGQMTNDSLTSVESLGDIDGDGFGDFLLSVPSGPSGNGETYLFHGPLAAGPHTTADASTTWVGEADNDMAFQLQPGPGDIDGDGIGDFIIGAHGESSVAASSGAAYIVHGPASPGSHSLAGADVKLTGVTSPDQAGIGVAIAGDLDGDGFDDVLVGSGNGSGVIPGGHGVFVWYGPLAEGSSDLTSADAALLGPADVMMGLLLAPAGDTDGDGNDDFLACLFQDGLCYLVRGPVGGEVPIDLAADVTFVAEELHAGLQSPKIGDVNGDGHLDFFFNSPWFSGAVGGEGAAHLFYGPVTGTVSTAEDDVRVTGVYQDHRAYCVGLGDLNDDGLDDLLIGAIGDDEVEDDAGAVFLFYGGGL
jgi:hypothetical protein